MTPPDVRDRQPTGRPPPPRPSRRGCPADLGSSSWRPIRRMRCPDKAGVPAPAGGHGVPVADGQWRSQAPRTRCHARLTRLLWLRRSVIASGRQEGKLSLGYQGHSHPAASPGVCRDFRVFRGDVRPLKGAQAQRRASCALLSHEQLSRGLRKSLPDLQPQFGGCGLGKKLHSQE